MQANSANKLVPPDALSYNSEGYVNDDEDISNIRSNRRQSHALSEMSDSYEDMNGDQVRDMTTNSAYNTASSVQVPREDPPSYDYIVAGNLYDEIPERYNRPPIVVTGPQPITNSPPVAIRDPLPTAMGQPNTHEVVAAEDLNTNSQAKFLCSFWQGRAEIGLRGTILILEFLMLAALIAAFITWSVASVQPPPENFRISQLSSAFIGTGFLAIPMFFFLIIVTLEEIIFLVLRLCITTRDACTNCLLVWDIVNSTLVGILFFLSTVASAGLCAIWINTVPFNSVPVNGEVSLFALLAILNLTAAILCIVKTVWIPALTYKKKATVKENLYSMQ